MTELDRTSKQRCRVKLAQLSAASLRVGVEWTSRQATGRHRPSRCPYRQPGARKAQAHRAV